MNTLETTRAFFDRYRRHDVDAMVELFAANGTIDYIPAGVAGPASEAGRAIWSALIDAFPNLTNDVTAIYVADHGRIVTAEVTIGGTQAKDAFGIENQGLSYSLPHVFIVHGNEDGEIIAMKAYWDNASWYTSLGRTNLS